MAFRHIQPYYLDQAACVSYNLLKAAADAFIALGKHPGTSSIALCSHCLRARYRQGTTGIKRIQEMALDISAIGMSTRRSELGAERLAEALCKRGKDVQLLAHWGGWVVQVQK